MNTKEYLEFHKALCEEARELSARKNHDYAGADGDTPFRNFEACEALGLCSVEAGFLVRMLDKIMRLVTFVRDGSLQVNDESFRDTCLDLVNYSVLFAAYVQSKEKSHE